MKRVWIAIALSVAFACRKETSGVVEPKVEMVTTSTASPWEIARGGSAIATKDRSVWIFIEPAFDPEGRQLPGIALGDAKGPDYGLLSGYFAPVIATAASDHHRDATVELKADHARIDFGPGLKISLYAEGVRMRAVIEGSAAILAPADNQEINATLDGRPIYARTVTAGDDPSSTVLRADHLSIPPVLSIESACPRITTPIKRGSTSVFVVAIGPNPLLSDPLFGFGADAAPQKDCTPSATSTLTIAHP